MPTISARLPDDEAAELDEVAELLGEDRSTVIRKALDEGVHTLRVRVAVQRYQTGEVSMNQAARIAGVSLGEWFDIAARCWSVRVRGGPGSTGGRCGLRGRWGVEVADQFRGRVAVCSNDDR